MRAYEAI